MPCVTPRSTGPQAPAPSTGTAPGLETVTPSRLSATCAVSPAAGCTVPLTTCPNCAYVTVGSAGCTVSTALSAELVDDDVPPLPFVAVTLHLSVWPAAVLGTWNVCVWVPWRTPFSVQLYE